MPQFRVLASLSALLVLNAAAGSARATVASVPIVKLWHCVSTDTSSCSGDGIELMSIHNEEISAAIKYNSFRNSSDSRPMAHAFDRQLPGLVPLHRYRNRNNGDYFYTLNAEEGTKAISNYGYVPEGVAFYVASSQLPGTVPLFRLVDQRNHFHRYTASADERDRLRYTGGFEFEGVEGYVWSSPATLPGD